jgi:hypothetical protein
MEAKSKVRILIVSIASGLAFGLTALIHIYHLQSPVFSPKRSFLLVMIFLSLSWVGYQLLTGVLRNEVPLTFSRHAKSAIVCFFIALLLLPHFLPVVEYPVSPFFQKTSNIKITIHVDENAGMPLEFKEAWLRQEDGRYEQDLQYSDKWTQRSNAHFLYPGETAEITWTGRVSKAVSLVVVMAAETNADVTISWDGEESFHKTGAENLEIRKKFEAPVGYIVFIVLAQLILATCALFMFTSLFQWMSDRQRRWFIWIVLVALGILTVHAQFQNIEIKGRISMQLERHFDVITGAAPGPWQYRVFPEWLIEALVPVAAMLGTTSPFFTVFVFIRVVQNLLIFSLAYRYFQESGFSPQISLIGIFFMTGSLLNAFNQSDLSFNTYFDVIFYLIAALLIKKGSYAWLPILMVFASLNRETSGLIPFMAVVAAFEFKDRWKNLILALVSLLAWAWIFVYVRTLYPHTQLMHPYDVQPGVALFHYNLSVASIYWLFRFFSLLPLLGLFVLKEWPPILKRYFLIMIPIWLVIHAFDSVISETRLFLVPHILVFIPAALLLVRYHWENSYPASSRVEGAEMNAKSARPS